MKTKLNSLMNRVDTRLAACAAAAGATVALPAVSDATIVWSGPVSINIPSTSPGVYLNVVNGVNNPSPAAVPGWDLNPFGTTGLSFFAATPTATSGALINATGGNSATLVDNLPVGFLISNAFTFGTNNAVETVGATAVNLSSSNNLFGFRFVDPSVNGGAVAFGWVRISLSATTVGQPRAIVEYAYENSGAPIAAGVVPEPTTFALLGVMAAGALGVRAWRGRKSA